jgi:hypothetical protein
VDLNHDVGMRIGSEVSGGVLILLPAVKGHGANRAAPPRIVTAHVVALKQTSAETLLLLVSSDLPNPRGSMDCRSPRSSSQIACNASPVMLSWTLSGKVCSQAAGSSCNVVNSPTAAIGRNWIWDFAPRAQRLTPLFSQSWACVQLERRSAGLTDVIGSGGKRASF